MRRAGISALKAAMTDIKYALLDGYTATVYSSADKDATGPLTFGATEISITKCDGSLHGFSYMLDQCTPALLFELRVWLERDWPGQTKIIYLPLCGKESK